MLSKLLKGFVIGNSGTAEDLKGLKNLGKLTIIATSNDFPTKDDLLDLQELQAL